MINSHFYYLILFSWMGLALILFPVLLRITAPYGRYQSNRWGQQINNRFAWIFMELPSLLIFMILFLTGTVPKHAAGWIFFSVWVLHYTNRIFIYPMRIRTRGKQMPLLIMILAIFFNFINAFLNGYWLGYLSEPYTTHWLKDPRLLIGLTIFLTGFILNQWSDTILISLRKGGKTGYFIPEKVLFRLVSCPNFLGEIMEWCGFAIMTWSLPGLSFALWTMINLIPRAFNHHKWYHNTFTDYPQQRKALIPWVL